MKVIKDLPTGEKVLLIKDKVIREIQLEPKLKCSLIDFFMLIRFKGYNASGRLVDVTEDRIGASLKITRELFEDGNKEAFIDSLKDLGEEIFEALGEKMETLKNE